MPEGKIKNIAQKSGAARLIVDFFCWLLGCAIYSVSLNMFIAPNRIAPGGVTGVATLLNYVFHTPIGVMILVLNVPLFILGWRYIGLKFILRTAAVTVMLSVVVDATAPFIAPYHGDRLLAALIGGVLGGAGLSIVFVRGATTGGTDIAARLLRKKKPHMSMGRVILMIDALLISAAMLVYRSVESGLYSVVFIFVSTRVIDSVLYGTVNAKMLMIVTDKADAIAQTVLSVMGRGATIVPARGAYTGGRKDVLYCAVRRSEVSALRKIAEAVDPDAFIIVSEVGEIIGEGFHSPGT